ncbi:hypothetical protein SAY86_019270 [Trapa natans]|uniref:Uncharacterized protein n=1 Tax=Trapa natans TaxID=22666 RepID=A0AAN7R5E9_TRANT|nr:hypothetical protein SAY86_019270 [Trapa natans]
MVLAMADEREENPDNSAKKQKVSAVNASESDGVIAESCIAFKVYPTVVGVEALEIKADTIGRSRGDCYQHDQKGSNCHESKQRLELHELYGDGDEIENERKSA